MPAYGYQQRLIDPEYGLMELREVSFDLSPDGLRRIAAFLLDCADQLDTGSFRSSHAHIDTYDRNWRHEHPDLDIVVNG